MVHVLKNCLQADGSFTRQRWQGVTERELRILIDSSARKPGGIMLRWQFRDADSHLMQHRRDFHLHESGAFLEAVSEMIDHAKTATPRRNILPGAIVAEDPLRKILREKVNELHSHVEAQADQGKPPSIDNDRQLSQRRPKEVGESDEFALEPQSSDVVEHHGFGSP